MSLPKIGATLVLDNEQEFKRALSEVNAGLKVDKSNLQMVEEQSKATGNAQTALKSKMSALQNTINSQNDKISILTAALDKSREKTGEHSKQTMKWQASLNNAKAELAKMENKMGEYSQAMDDSEKSTVSLADAINGVTGALGISLPPAAQAAVDKLDGISASGAALTAVLIGVTAKLAGMTIETAKTADNLLTLSTQTGLSTDQLQEFEYASELVDVSTDTLTGSMAKMIRNMTTAKKGTGDTAEAFKKLHVRITDARGELRSSQDVFMETIDALGKIKNETERDALAMQIFGKSAQDLNPLIAAGSDKLAELAKEAHNMGYVMSEETLQSFGALDDAMQRFNNMSETLHNSLAEALLPPLTALFSVIGSIPVPVLQTIVVIVSTITTLVLLVKAIKELTATGKAVAGFFDLASGKMDMTAVKILAVVLAVTALLAVLAVLAGKGGEVTRAADAIGQSTTNAMESATANMPKYAIGTRSARKGRALVGENGPEIVDFEGGETVLDARRSRKLLGGGTAYYDQRQYIFKVDDIEDYVRIKKRLDSEKMNIRQGYAGR